MLLRLEMVVSVPDDVDLGGLETDIEDAIMHRTDYVDVEEIRIDDYENEETDDELYPHADRTEDGADYDCCYDVYDKHNYLLSDNHVWLDDAIDRALSGNGMVVRQAWYRLDKHGNINFDRHIKDIEVWIRDGWKFDGEKFVEVQVKTDDCKEDK